MRRQLDLGCAQLGEANPGLYRDLALYLQVLREVLAEAVERACFHLATRFHPQRYCELPDDHRNRLHEGNTALVRQTTSLLTVEQLSGLAGELAAGRQRRHRDLLHQLSRPATDDLGMASAEPEGSVQLNFEPPVDFGWSALASLGAGSPVPDREPAPELDPLDDSAELLGVEGIPAALAQDAAAPWDSPLLPQEPQTLLAWLDGYERALVRRLRNLSHGLNVELLRSGLSRSLLPLSLLEAALLGQLEPLAAPANLLRVQLPVSHPSGGQLESVAMLVRPADLELEHPRLRSCRARLQCHRQEIRRMADQHRRLQRRLQALEAERLWHQDHPRYRQP
ncbi:hypothetical protein KBY96_04265 [Cyanobium sp. ATX 6A2]|uniref:hypothetical protein n=1 Tax=Cyanobium sp. ATX 6A2 TaxID=2823700 RepID=UPI0020CFE00A|nr:hypothetical protein [Cyanobium sp. ATX 6A2]MCP9887148.1 hypothetical protein [Cyanobium sp. ATX 6A2]